MFEMSLKKLHAGKFELGGCVIIERRVEPPDGYSSHEAVMLYLLAR